MEAETRRCPFCAEVIQAAAIKCRYCESMLQVPVDPPPRADRPRGEAALIWGLIAVVGGVFACVPVLLGPVAWVLGRKHEEQCRAMGVEPDGPGRAGKILGMIATAIVALCFLVFLVILAIALVVSAEPHRSPF